MKGKKNYVVSPFSSLPFTCRCPDRKQSCFLDGENVFNQAAESEHSIDPQGKRLLFQHLSQLDYWMETVLEVKGSPWGIHNVTVYTQEFKMKWCFTKM